MSRIQYGWEVAGPGVAGPGVAGPDIAGSDVTCLTWD